jgi:C1q domain
LCCIITVTPHFLQKTSKMKTKALSIISLLSLQAFLVTAQVKIGATGAPHASAVLDLDGGTNKGLLLPRLTNVQITALSTAPDGMMIYNTTDGFLYLRKTGAWQKISDATSPSGGGLTLPFSATSSTVGGAEFSITHTGTFGDVAYFSNTAGGGAITTGAGFNKLNMVSGNTGIGLPAGLSDNPILGKLVVRGTVGAVSAIFGDNTAGVSIMNNLPSVGFNYYYNASGKAISTGFGASLGQDPSNGRIYLTSSSSSSASAGAAMSMVDRLIILANGNTGIAVSNPLATLQVGKGAGTLGGTAQFDGTTYSSHFSYSTTEDTYIRGGKAASQVIINDQGNGNIRLAENGGNVGIGNASPQAPLSFSNATGNKLDLYYTSATSRYGIGLQGSLMQLYSGSAADDIAFGYGSSTTFTERMRIKGNGNVGIGIAPTAKLHVAGNAIVTGDQQIGGVVKIAGGNPDAGDVLTAVSADGSALWRIPNAGRYAFHVSYNTSSGALSTLAFNANNANLDFIEDFVFNIPTQKFTAPVDGLYQFNYCVFFASFSSIPFGGIYELVLYKNSTPADNLVGKYEGGTFVTSTLNGSTVLRLNANDEVRLAASASSALVQYSATTAGNYFSGYRIK